MQRNKTFVLLTVSCVIALCIEEHHRQGEILRRSRNFTTVTFQIMSKALLHVAITGKERGGEKNGPVSHETLSTDIAKLLEGFDCFQLKPATSVTKNKKERQGYRR